MIVFRQSATKYRVVSRLSGVPTSLKKSSRFLIIYFSLPGHSRSHLVYNSLQAPSANVFHRSTILHDPTSYLSHSRLVFRHIHYPWMILCARIQQPGRTVDNNTFHGFSIVRVRLVIVMYIFIYIWIYMYKRSRNYREKPVLKSNVRTWASRRCCPSAYVVYTRPCCNQQPVRSCNSRAIH